MRSFLASSFLSAIPASFLRAEFWSTSYRCRAISSGAGHRCHAQATDLLLDQRQLFQIALQERHLLLLSFAVTIADDIVVLLFDLIQLYLQLDDLQEQP